MQAPDDLKSLLDRSVDVLSEKRADELGNFRSVPFESEVSGVEQMQFRAGRILQKCLRARLGKYSRRLRAFYDSGKRWCLLDTLTLADSPSTLAGRSPLHGVLD
jgi:hypothetical protein